MLGNDALDKFASIVDLLIQLVVPLENLARLLRILLGHELEALVGGISQRLLKSLLVNWAVRVRRAGPVHRLIGLNDCKHTQKESSGSVSIESQHRAVIMPSRCQSRDAESQSGIDGAIAKKMVTHVLTYL